MNVLVLALSLSLLQISELREHQLPAEHSSWTSYRLMFGFADYAQRHRVEWFKAREHQLVSQRFEPVGTARGVVHVVHGYLDHTGIQQPIINALTDQGFAVRSIDLPGHGVSQGPRAQVNSMEHYSEALRVWIKDQPRPLRIVAHSMGGAVVMEAMRQGLITPSDQIVLIAPLVRWKGWRISAIGQFLLGWAINSVPRGVHATSHDQAFQELRRDDPLRFDRVPLNWTRSLRRWSRSFEQQTALHHRPKVLQGRRDGVVDWRANYRLIQSVFPRASFHFFKNGKHHLQGESPTIRPRVLAMIVEHF